MLPSDAVLSALQWLLASAVAVAADLPTGQIVDEVVCAADRSQSYALYLPRAYTASRTWPVIFAFDPGGRGRVPVERYQDYLKIVAEYRPARGGR